MEKKVCTKCGIEKELTKENFEQRKAKNGFSYRSECRKCRSEANNTRRIRKYPFICKGCGKKCLALDKRKMSYCSDVCANNLKKLPLLKCVSCGNNFKNYSSRTLNICTCCNMKKIEEEKIVRDIEKSLKKLQKTLEKISKVIDKEIKKTRKQQKKYNHECSCCGEVYISKNKQSKYCSDKCRKKSENRKKEIRKSKRFKQMKSNGQIDNDITIEKLIKRDGKECYLCGCHTSFEDYEIRDEYFIIGQIYPTIEHVIAIANGGTHTWDNVKVACYKCNTIKGIKQVIA